MVRFEFRDFLSKKQKHIDHENESPLNNQYTPTIPVFIFFPRDTFFARDISTF